MSTNHFIDSKSIAERIAILAECSINNNGKNRPLSKEILSQKLNVSKPTLYGLLDNADNLKLYQIQRLADIYHVTPDYILYGEKCTSNELTTKFEMLKPENRKFIMYCINYFL